MVPDDRFVILARRRRFLLAALGSMTAVGMACDDSDPEVCLSVYAGGMGGAGGEGDAGQGGTGGPQVCLIAPPGGMGGSGGDGGAGGQGG